jgi:site-specific recombinase XerD
VTIVARRKAFQLTPFAAEFAALYPASRDVARQFDLWLKASCRPIRALTAVDLEQFLQRLAETTRHDDRARVVRRRQSLNYFDWLHARDFLRFDPRLSWPRSNFPLPQQALQFLDLLRPTHGISTVRSYATSLRQFHIWLHADGTSIADVDRSKTEAWLQWLHARGLAACSRVHVIQHIRAYLEWLEEQHALPAPAVPLVRGSDLPKLPKYLPRPLPPDVDAKLQRRLKKSKCNYQLGLLLMRRTGIRIGELISLPYHCVRADHAGNTLLKVPLGKLATERLVPLDPKTITLLAKLRREGPRKRALLFVTTDGRKTRYDLFRQALVTACNGLSFAEPMTTHRLRHTYATSMLAAGMSLPSVMRLLGHTDYRMTLRYAAITDSTVFAEFASALAHNAERYPDLAPTPTAPSAADPLMALPDLIRYLHKRAADDNLERATARSLVQRLRRLRTDLRKFFRSSTPERTSRLAG